MADPNPNPKPSTMHHDHPDMNTPPPDEKRAAPAPSHRYAGAQAANAAEHAMSTRRALAAYAPAVCWSLVVSMSIIMEGYDTILLGNFLGFPGFQRQFGVYGGPQAGYQVEAKWQSAMGGGSTAGSILGAFLNGWLIKWFGFKPVFCSFMVVMAAFVFISFFGMTIELQAVGQVLCG
jgi:SP family general alpha glucoside:H+ symporter-like MFS transporter